MQKQILKCEWLQGWDLRGKVQLHFRPECFKEAVQLNGAAMRLLLATMGGAVVVGWDGGAWKQAAVNCGL